MLAIFTTVVKILLHKTRLGAEPELVMTNSSLTMPSQLIRSEEDVGHEARAFPILVLIKCLASLNSLRNVKPLATSQNLCVMLSFGGAN